ncbi:MAG: helix-turn-helix domain-containing protein [Bacteroidales bacterium]|nr:helix-turn-helix domain-containing protein [Lachnoclostridium sp.]MCM1385158.1 helix-turn-helix domain-containing protein [Lachnoclostridium sp.]MCM1465560.1 helix-turn-helix domain-containing protein [Bacteroidales bacterium]
MAFLSKNIRYLRKKNEWSQDYIAEKLGYKSYTTIQKWEMGTSEPPLKKTRELADLFNVDIDDLTNRDLELPNTSKNVSKRGITINVLGRVAAGIPIEAIENIIDTEEITIELARTGNFFGLQIHGDSMSPNICDGDVVIVRQQDDAESGDIVIATINGTDATCKRLRKYKDGIELIANNPKYAPLDFSLKEIIEKPIRIIGKVVELRRKL